MVKKTFGMLALHGATMAFAGGGEVVRVDIYGEIGWEVYAPDFLKAFRGIKAGTEIDLRMHSYGGSVLEGWAIANAIEMHDGDVTCTIEGTAASMATVIAMKCDKVIIPENGHFMIHRLSNWAGGNADDIANAAETTKVLEGEVVDFYASKTGIDAQEIRDMMAAETWMTGKVAVEKGFCQQVTEPVKAAAFVGEKEVIAKFGKVPGSVALALAVNAVEDKPNDKPDVKPDVKPDGKVDEKPDGKLALAQKIKNILTGGKNAPKGGADLSSDVMRLNGELKTARDSCTALTKERDELQGRVKTLEQQATDVVTAISESGFTLADSADLPAPEDGPGSKDKNSAYDQWKAMSDGPERSKFFAANEDAILATASAE